MTEQLFDSYNNWFVPDFQSRKFSPEFYHTLIDKIVAKNKNLLEISEAGKSFEGRPIRLIKTGNGQVKILLWSQMHGDESTATMAIADILNYFALFFDKNETKDLLSKVILFFLPMLNPDGAVRHQRRTAQKIDMNRDAISLVTPEANILKNLQNRLNPEFGFNLHDQELCTILGTKDITAMSLLAPAMDQGRSYNEVRIKAKKVAASIVQKLTPYIPGIIACYNDGFEPRAFGDSMQNWGTSTVLIESGHTPGDPNKNFIRKLNAVGMLATFFNIASGNYEKTDISLYENLPLNAEGVYDVVIRNILIRHKDGRQTSADLGISCQVDTHTADIPKLVDIGDLSIYVGIKEINGEGKIIPEENLLLDSRFDWEKWF
jgi:hypothetical protein